MSPFAMSSNHAQDSVNGAIKDWNVTRLSTLVTSSQEQTEETGFPPKKFHPLLSPLAPVKMSSPVRPRQDQPMNAVCQFHFMEVEQGSDGYIK